MRLIQWFLASVIVPSCFAQDPATEPPISLVQASQIAQDTLKTQNLGSDFYLRSITLRTRPENPAEVIYEATFEPTTKSRAMVGAEPPPIRYRVIVVDMRGRGTVEDREFTPSRVIRRKTTSGTDATNPEKPE